MTLAETISEKKEFLVVGKRLARVDGLEKVLGNAIYAGDQYPANSLFARFVRSPHPHALVKRIDVSRALAIPGVVGVFTAKDIPGINDVGALTPDMPLLAGEKVRYAGDQVALVAAESQAVADDAAAAVEVEYELLEPVFSPVEALKANAPKVHSAGNVAKHYKIRKGDVNIGFKEADVIVENTYSTTFQEHMPIESDVGFAVPEFDGTITVVGSMQSPFYVQGTVAKTLGITQDHVRIIQAQTGGAFGCKGDEVQSIVGAGTALVAYKTKRPAFLLFSREESVLGHSKRHPFIIKHKTGAKRDGALTAAEVEMIADTGAYASLGPLTILRAIIHATGPYVVPHVKADAYSVYTTNLVSGSFRGFGNPQAHFAAESQIEALAKELNIDPLEMRLKNILRPGSITCTGQPLDESVGLEECIRRGVRESEWHKKRAMYGSTKGLKQRGIGIALMYHGNSLGPESLDYSAAYIAVNRDSSIRYRTGIAEYGTGAPSGHVQIVAEVIGVPMELIHLERPDTSSTPDAGPTVASRSTVMGGKAALVAASKVRSMLNEVAADLLGCGEDDVQIRNGIVYSDTDPSRTMTFKELVSQYYNKKGTLVVSEKFVAPRPFFDEEEGYGSPYLHFTFGALIAEVEVDLQTGYIQVVKMTTAYDCGKAINPLQLEGQVEGATAQGIGYAIMEELAFNKNGEVLNPNLADYFIPTSLDCPEMKVILVEDFPCKIGPWGAKAMAEPPIDSVAPAVTNAIYHATGVRIKDLPATPEKVLLGLKRPKGSS